jgi:hypothetical protein
MPGLDLSDIACVAPSAVTMTDSEIEVISMMQHSVIFSPWDFCELMQSGYSSLSKIAGFQGV